MEENDDDKCMGTRCSGTGTMGMLFLPKQKCFALDSRSSLSCRRGDQQRIPQKVRLKCNQWLSMHHFYSIPICWSLLLVLLSANVALANSNNNKYQNRPPRFLIDGHSEIVLRLKEGPDTPVGSLIYKLRGSDPDNDPLVFGIRDTGYGSDVLRIENIGNNEANLYLAQELDRETKDEYSIILTLTDNRLDGNFVTQSLLLLVEDVNDNQPIFKPFQSALEIAEHSRPGIVTTVEATDLDEGAYGQVVYHLQELQGDDDVFSITTVHGKGVIRLVRDLDYEKKNLYQLRVLAVDRNNQGKVNTGTAALLIKVRDIEDQPPEFVSVTPVIRIPENTPKFSKISQVRAIDGDRGVNNPIKYTLHNGFGLFSVNSSTGVISTVKELDRENTENQINGAYIITIAAEEVPSQSQQKSRDQQASSIVQTEVTIILNDINDESPTFRSPFYDCEINENAQINTPVTFLGTAINEVFDHDQGLNGTFDLFLYPINDIFEVIPGRAINDATFSVRVKNPFFLDFEQVKELNFTLVAKELAPNGFLSRVPIRIQIRDQNDNFPEFAKPLYEVSVPENVQMGAVIATVQAFDSDSGHFGTHGIRYTNMGGGIANLLNLNAVTGAISINSAGGSAFDRELVAKHYLTVEARDDMGKGNRNTVQLVINIEDVNDNAPQFLQSKYEAILQENSLTFENPLQVEAKDVDLNGTRNSEVRYEIVDGEFRRNFTINVVTGVIQPKYSMDFEMIPAAVVRGNVKAIYLTIAASDGGMPSLSSQVPLVVYVQDVNDHPPIFQRNFYESTIPEDLVSGTPILEVKAHDGDGTSPNNRVVYRIQKGASDKFVIGSDSGVISIAPMANLDPDLTEYRTMQYSLVVVALDSGVGEQQLSAATVVNITIADVNNKLPIFQDPGTVVIKENTPVGTAVFRIIARDPDSKPILLYRIDNQTSEARSEEGVLIKQAEYDYLSAFELNEDDGLLKVIKILDREKVEHIKLGFTVEDVAALKGRQVVPGILNIVVEDENDNNPRFQKPFYKRSITENSPNGVTVASVVAFDVDKNRTITYSMGGPKEVTRFLHLDEESGEIVVANRIDREVNEWLNVTVRAVDNGVPVRSSLVDVFIHVLDENDNNPMFVTGDLQNVTVRENSRIGEPIATIQAKDIDAGEFGKITYLIDRISSQGKFAIDPSSGVLSVADKLDRETKDSYMIVIEAWDNYQFGYLSGESRNAFKQIHVTILDENDSPPVLHFPSTCVQTTEYHDLNEIITKIRATDEDDLESGNGMVEFQIVGGNEKNLFKIVQKDAQNAAVYANDFLQGRYGNYTLKVSVNDKGIPPNVVYGELQICVTDYNDHAPVFISPTTNTTIRVPENATVGTSILQIVARDDDVGPNAAVRYRLKADPLGNYRMFSIEPDTGILRLKVPLDREKQKIHEIRIEAFDQGIPTPLSSDLDVIVYVRNVNDYEPQFIVEQIAVNFTEHTAPGVERKKLPDTVDRDEVDDLDDPPTMVCYYIVHGDEENQFDLDPISHVLVVARELDREVKSNHTLLIKATEECQQQGGEQKHEQREPSPQQQQQQRPSSSSSSSSPHEMDLDNSLSETRIHETRRMPTAARYKTISSKYVDERFVHSRSIRSSEGYSSSSHSLLPFAKLLDYKREIANLLLEGVSIEEILEEDSTLVKVAVYVDDINDNAPVFESKVFTGGVTTETDFGTPFMQIRAHDRDQGVNAKVSYYKLDDVHKTLTEGLENVNAEPFLVDEETGFVHLNFDPLKGMKGYFDFRVVANDTDGNQDTAHVFIYLLREDQRVRFVLRQQPAEIRERLMMFRDALGNVTNSIVNVDDFKVHENKDGSVDKTKTDLYIHLVDRIDNSIMDVSDVLKSIDGNIERLDELFKDFNVLDTQPAEAQMLTGEYKKGQILIWLIFSNVFIAALLIILASLCLSQRTSYRRQLRAARVNTFGNNVTDLVNRGATRVPNTNKHSVEGSNPIWLKGYENEWYKNDETYSQGSGQDSLDENIIVDEQFVNPKTVHKDGVTLGVGGRGGMGGMGGLGVLSTATTARNLNLYQQIDKLSNTANILAKKLETTEL